MHWFEKKYALFFWKRQMNDVLFVWRGSKEDLEVFVWHFNGIEDRVQFILDV